jgi:hypothetical protein
VNIRRHGWIPAVKQLSRAVTLKVRDGITVYR